MILNRFDFSIVKIPFVDEIIASVVTKTHQQRVWKNTIILFISLPDNNDSPLENNVRRTAFIYSPLLKLQQRVSNQMFHIIDLLPTLVKAANLKWRTRDRIFIDGLDQWEALNANDELRLNVYGDNFFIHRNWKLSLGSKDGSGFYGSIANVNMESDKDKTEYDFNTYVKSIFASEIYLFLDKLAPERIMYSRNRARVHCNLMDIDEPAVKNIKCSPSKPCLFDLLEDPCEFDNKQEPEFDVRRQLMGEELQRFVNGEKIDEVSVRSTIPHGDDIEAQDGAVTGIVLGVGIVTSILVFIILVCIKEKCNQKRSVYHDKSKIGKQGLANSVHQTPNGVSVIGRSIKF